MSRLRLYIDEDSQSHRLVQALRTRGVDLVTALEVGRSERPDEDHLLWATQAERVLLTYNASDFCRLHGEFLANSRHHAGIIIAAQQRFSIGEQMRLVLRLAANKPAEEMKDRLESLANWRLSS